MLWGDRSPSEAPSRKSSHLVAPCCFCKPSANSRGGWAARSVIHRSRIFRCEIKRVCKEYSMNESLLWLPVSTWDFWHTLAFGWYMLNHTNSTRHISWKSWPQGVGSNEFSFVNWNVKMRRVFRQLKVTFCCIKAKLLYHTYLLGHP